MEDDKEWWHTDSRGRRIGYMWPEDMLAVIDSIWGPRKGIAGFADYNDYNRTTVERWCNGKAPIPLHLANLVYMLEYIAITVPRTDRNARPSIHLFRANARWLAHEKNPKLRFDKRPMG